MSNYSNKHMINTKMTDTTKITELRERMMQEYRVKFNEVLGRMYNLEIIPDIQSRINERIPKAGGFMVFGNDELADFLSKAIDQVAEETIRAVCEEMRTKLNEITDFLNRQLI